MFVNLTTEDFSGLLKSVRQLVERIDPTDWPVRHLSGAEVSHSFDEHYVDPERGLTLSGGFFPLPPANWDHIVVPGNVDLAEYEKLVRSFYSDASFSSTHFMDADGFMDWHTNLGESPEKPYRLYATYNDTPGSFFRYIPHGSREVITLEEPVGWYVKVFNVEREILHCIKSNANRWSIGMRFSNSGGSHAD